MRHFLKRKDILQLSDSFISSNCIQGAKSVKQKIVYMEICFLQDYFQQQELENKGKISQWRMFNKLECVYFVLVKISAYESFGFCPVWCACLYYHHSISGGRNQGVQDKHELYNVLQASLGYITSKVSKYMIITQTCFKSKEEIIPILQSSGFQHLINFPPKEHFKCLETPSGLIAGTARLCLLWTIVDGEDAHSSPTVHKTVPCSEALFCLAGKFCQASEPSNKNKFCL